MIQLSFHVSFTYFEASALYKIVWDDFAESYELWLIDLLWTKFGRPST